MVGGQVAKTALYRDGRVAVPIGSGRKIRAGGEIHGTEVVPRALRCPTGWLYDPGESPEVAKLAVETGLWPLKEAINGAVTHT